MKRMRSLALAALALTLGFVPAGSKAVSAELTSPRDRGSLERAW